MESTKKGHQLTKTAESFVCNKCPPGTIYHENSCLRCSLGSFSTEDSCISCEPGQLTKNYPASAESDCFTPCSAEEAVQFAFLMDEEIAEEDMEIIEEYFSQVIIESFLKILNFFSFSTSHVVRH
jgi:hypothetical protein